jgi:hypothetical protein
MADSPNGAGGDEPPPESNSPLSAPVQVEAQSLIPTANDIFLLARQQNFDVALKLLQTYPEYWTSSDEDGHSLLHWAALVGRTDFLKAAVEHGNSVDALAHNKQTPLMWAVLRGHTSTARALLDMKASLQVKDSLGATSLMIAVQHKSYPALLLMMHRAGQQRSSLLADGDKNGCTAGHWAAYKGDLTALKLLDYFQADLNVLDSAKMLPLHRAVCASQPSVVEFLMEKKCDPLAKNADGKTCLDITEDKHDPGMQKLLQKLIQRTSSSRGNGNKVEVEDLESQVSSEKEVKPKEKGLKGVMSSIMKDKAAHKIFPVFWLVCVSMASFEYIMDLRAAAYEAAPFASMFFELGVPLSVLIFFWVALKDPGRIASRPKGNSGVEELMKALDRAEADGKITDFSRLCTTTWILKGPRTKYCKETEACIEDFDHYCVWLNCAIGRGNHREFCCLAISEFLTQCCYIWLCGHAAFTIVPYQSFGSWVWSLITGYPLLVLIGIVQCLTAPWVFMLIMHQVRLIVMNLTTNEMMNMHRYEHFWKTVQVVPGHSQRVFQNPFHKGSAMANCMDFWWLRTRSKMIEQPLPSASSCAHGCDHHHH